MKQFINILLLGFLLLGMNSCEKDLPVYNTLDCWLNFVYYKSDGSILGTEEVTDEMRYASYSFVYVGEDVEIDTVWFEISTMGFVSGEDRPLELEQILTGENDAKADVHYVAFSNEELKTKFYMIPAGKVNTKIPVIVKKDHSLDDGDVNLQFTFKDNGYFKPGYAGLSVRTLSISAKLTKPSVWEKCYCDYLVGTYGPEKHRLMIEWTGEKWDDEYIKELTDGDSAYAEYLADWLARKLEEENAKRIATGQEPYKEADGTLVSFEPKSWT